MTRVHLTRSRRSGARISPDLKLYACPVRDGDATMIGDLPVTTVARTVVDVARHDDRTGWGFATGDRALRMGLTSVEELDEQLRRAARRPWIKLARQIVGLLDPLSESPGESRSRWLMFQGGIPQPALQVDVPVMGGRVVYTPDFMWEEYGVLGEFDGDYKYDLVPGTDEWKARKRRDEALQAEGWVIVHWAWEDLSNPVAFIATLRNAFLTARRLRERAS
ncbi:MAG: hypothetical protein Q4G35_11910 [Propionibacteriaceae bacterium]|nr:hypothetical protein [Propionibacteriaceae bacterium]